ncbi:MAG: tRNA (guanosine(46)-N7)-methyltransferase TrmB [Clostridia bacterium]
MRMRKKKNIDKRIANCSDVMVVTPEDYKGKWSEFFDNDNPIYIEIGCGKGRFILEHARLYPNINYVAIEREENALIIATEKALNMELNNLVFLSYDALEICKIFDENEVSRIYLNFSDPWPQRRHEHRRLTHSRFLANYDVILAPFGQLHFKSDNQHLFEFSLEQFTKCGFRLQNLSLDLHKTSRFNVMTEYEKRFSEQGFRIYRVEAVRTCDVKEIPETSQDNEQDDTEENTEE